MSVRVIRSGSGQSAPVVHTHFTPTARRIAAEQWNARLEAERTLGEARRSSEAIREEVRNAVREFLDLDARA